MEGSTRLLEQQPQAYHAALARHHALVRQAVHACGGTVLETIGDALRAVFARARDGVAAAVQAQHALETEPWGEVGAIRIGMGLHTAEVDRHGAYYVGAPLDRCARILAAAHGGQVLLSEVTAGLVEESLPDGVTLRDLGTHRLKDLQRPEHLFQVVLPELADDFPPLRSLDAYSHNLPLQATPFIGREQQLEALKRRLLRPEVRLLTLTGPGGTGKTRLALQTAADVVDRFDDGVFFVSLAPITDPDLVPSAIAQALEVKEIPGRSIQDVLKEYLQYRALLLVLDNFEQVSDAASLVADLLAASPRSKVLVTSRAVLRVYGEHDSPVPPLTLPDRAAAPSALHVSQNEAVRLFIERAQAARPDFSVTNETAPTVAELCHRLDGLPLAIELAAARVRALPVQALLERMDRRLPLLKGGPRDAPARQQTLHGTIAWSYDLLNPEEQMLFRRLAVFRGCTLEAIDDVCVARAVHPSSSSVAPSSVALEPLTMEVLDSVTSLVEKSLLRQEETADGQPWYVMLETIREFALEQLEACSEADIVRRRHVLYCLRLAETAEPQLFGPQQGTWLARLEREHDNLRGALRWCEAQGYAEPVFRLAAALTWFWAVRGHMSEGRERFATLLARFRRHGAGGSRAAMRARALHAAATLHSFQGDYDAARSLQEEGLRVLEEQGDMAGVYAALEALGLIASQQHDYQAARAYLEKGIDVARAQQDKHAIGNALHNLANVLHEQGEYAAARALLEESLPFYMEATEAGDTRGAANVYKFLGIVALDQGDHDTARLMTEKSLALMDQVGDLRQIAIVMVGRGSVATAQGDYVTARECLSQSLATLREIGDVAAIAFVLERFAGLAAAQGHAQRAIRIAGAAAAMREASGVPLTPSAQGKLESALHAARQALGETATAAAWEAGCTLSVEEAVAYALADTDTNSVPDGRATDTTRSTPLSRREQEVAVLIARGYTNRQIARELVITEGTAANHVIHILNKLGFSSRAQVAAWMVEQGLAGAR